MSATSLTLLYDGIIAIIVAAVPLYFVALIRFTRQGKGKGQGGFGLFLAFVWLVVVYGSFIEPRILTVETTDLRIGPGDHMLKVALISDTHLGQYRYADWLQKVVARVNALDADVVLIAGDVVTTSGGIGSLVPLRDLKSKLGTYVVLGNWDYAAGAVDVRKAIESQGAEVLTNEMVLLDVDGSPVRLIGLDDLTHGKPDIDLALGIKPNEETTGEAPPMANPPPPDFPTILLVHNPDAVSLAESRGIDLVLAGHTHGGQIRLPWWGAVPHIPITIGQRYDKGLFDIGPTQLFITSGVGESGTRARLFDPPQISFLQITY